MSNIKKIAVITTALLLTTGATVHATTGDSSSGSQVVVKASLEVKNAPKLVSKTNTGITLEWEKVDAATTYIVKYSKNSVANSTLPNPQYDNETDPVTETGTVITNLEPDTDYYFSIVAVDKDNNESDTYSDELQVKTEAVTSNATGTGINNIDDTTKTSANNFALANVSAQDNKTIVLEFSSAIGADAITLKITKTTDNSDVPVENVTLDPTNPTKAIATIATVIDPKSSYSVTVIKATDAQGNNITQGPNGIKEFLTPETLIDLTAAPPIQVDTGSNINPVISPITKAGSGILTNASGAVVPNLEAAKTGTKENLIVLMALVLSFGIVYAYRRKQVR